MALLQNLAVRVVLSAVFRLALTVLRKSWSGYFSAADGALSKALARRCQLSKRSGLASSLRMASRVARTVRVSSSLGTSSPACK
jgi:hypothetical protein